MVLWAHPSPQPKEHLDRFSRFCTAHDRDRQTADRSTDRQTTTRSITISRIYVPNIVLRCGLIIIVVVVAVKTFVLPWYPETEALLAGLDKNKFYVFECYAFGRVIMVALWNRADHYIFML